MSWRRLLDVPEAVKVLKIEMKIEKMQNILFCYTFLRDKSR